MPTTIKVTMSNIESIVAKRGLNKTGNAQKLLTEKIYRFAEPYSPFRSKTLIRTAIVEDTSITYTQPYSRYLYFGKVMEGKAPKKVTNMNLNFQGSPTRGAFWIPRMMKDRGNEIGETVAKASGGTFKP